VTATIPWAADGVAARRPARRHGTWLVAGLVVASLLVALGGFDVAGLLSHEPVSRHHRWSGTVTAVAISVGSGSITVVGSDQPGAVVEATGARGLNAPSDHETMTDGRLQIRSACSFVLGGDWCSLNYHVTVPKGASVTVSAGDGSARVSGITGPLTLSTSDGSVEVAGGSGPLSLHSSDGGVNVDGARSQRVQASSSDGNVTIRFATVPASIRADSSDGSVVVEVPPGPDLYRVDTSAADGHVSTAVRTAPTSLHHIDVSSSDGNVTVRYGSTGAG
jgi:hypothetical protein